MQREGNSLVFVEPSAAVVIHNIAADGQGSNKPVSPVPPLPGIYKLVLQCD